MEAIIIGGVAAGMSAASKLKRTLPQARIRVYERGKFLSYGACGIPYYVGGINVDPDLLIARSREDFEKQGIQTFLRHEAVSVDPVRRQVRVRDLDSGREFEDGYDRLMIAVGCDSAVLPIPGADLPGVFYLKSMEDGLLLEKILSLPGVRSAVIVGGGYIGVEMAEALLARQLSVTLVEASERLLTPFEPAFSAMAAQELERQGVRLRLNERVSAIEIQGNERVVITAQGSYSADLVIMCAGVVPATGFLKGSGLRLARNGAVMVDRQMRASYEGVYAAGDCAVVYNRIQGKTFFCRLARWPTNAGASPAATWRVKAKSLPARWAQRPSRPAPLRWRARA